MLPIRINIPERKSLLKRFEIKPINHVVKAAPKVPQMKKGVARREADAPKVLVKRDIFVGKTDEVPNPAIAAPTLKSQTFRAESKIPIPSRIVERLRKSILFSFKKRKKTGATPRPTTKNTKYKVIGGRRFIAAPSSTRCV